MALFFAPVANLVLSSVRHDEQGIASGAHNAIRELGGVFGVAVLASVFAHYGGYQNAQAFTDGVVPAVKLGALIVALGGVAALLIPRKPVSDCRSLSRSTSATWSRPRRKRDAAGGRP